MITKLRPILANWVSEVVDKENVAYVFKENMPDEHSPELLQDAIALKEKLLEHQANGDTLAIINDYDADGMTSGAILTILMRVLGIEHFVITPDRVKDGYGLNPDLVDTAVKDGAQAIITCDNGITAYEGVERAKELGIPIYVTDHHPARKDELGNLIIPDSDLMVHPAFGDYPWKEISGGMVAYKVASLFFDDENFTQDLQDQCKVYAMISTISDVMPLNPHPQNENRKFVLEGLELIREGKAEPIQVLLSVLNQKKETVDEQTVGFQIGPTLNAAGRIASPMLSYRLLVETNPELMRALANKMKETNETRKELTRQAEKEVFATIRKEDSAQVVLVNNVKEGIVGLLSGNVTKELFQPSIVFTQGKIEDGKLTLKGSARSNTVSIAEAMANVDQSLIIKWGGHSQAAGITIFQENLDEFRKQLVKEVDKLLVDYVDDSQKPIEVAYEEAQAMARELSLMRPFGQGFRPPIFSSLPKINLIKTYSKKGNVLVIGETFEKWVIKGMDRPDFMKTIETMTVYQDDFKYLEEKFGEKEALKRRKRFFKPLPPAIYRFDMVYYATPEEKEDSDGTTKFNIHPDLINYQLISENTTEQKQEALDDFLDSFWD